MEKDYNNLSNESSEPIFNTQAGVRAQQVVPIEQIDSKDANHTSSQSYSNAPTPTGAESSRIINLPFFGVLAAVFVAGILAGLVTYNSITATTGFIAPDEEITSQENKPDQQVESQPKYQGERNNAPTVVQPLIQRKAERVSFPNNDREEYQIQDRDWKEHKKDTEKEFEKARKKAEKRFEKANKEIEKLFKGEGGGKDKKEGKHKDKKDKNK